MTITNDEAVPAAEAEREAEPRTPYRILGDLEEPVLALADYAEVLAMMSMGLQEPHAGALFRVSRDIAATVETVKNGRSEAWHAMHPRRADGVRRATDA